MKIPWMKFRIVYFLLSGGAIAFGIYALLFWGVKLGIDFKGGSLIEYHFEKEINTSSLESELSKLQLGFTSIQESSDNNYLLRFGALNSEDKKVVADKIEQTVGFAPNELKYENVGPSIGPDLTKKTIIALSLASISILFWIANQFKSIKYGVCAILAMFHDTFILIGSFAVLGKFFGAEIDFLFVTALLTTLSFSVHDTIVVYDRIREIRKRTSAEWVEIANMAVSETMRRSINNSLTIIFMLLALIILGGTSIKWFAVALLIGTIAGTYSSPFVAIPLLVLWSNVIKKRN